MILEPFFSLNPLNSQIYTYDPANPEAPYAFAQLANYGVITTAQPTPAAPFTLENQYNNNEIILGRNPVLPNEQTIIDYQADFHRRCTSSIYIVARNVSPDNQFLLLFSLHSYPLTPAPQFAQFFVFTELVRIEEISGDEQIAILLDAGNSNVFYYIRVRLASTLPYRSNLAFRGMDCYLL